MKYRSRRKAWTFRLVASLAGGTWAIAYFASPAWAYMGETGYIDCTGPNELYTTVWANIDHHHRMSGLNADLKDAGREPSRSYVGWGDPNEGRWTTGTYEGTVYSYSSSGAGCERPK